MGRGTVRRSNLKWYPRSWRDRYGEDLAMFLQDRYGTGPIPMSARVSMVWSGSTERLRAGGIFGTSADADTRIRGASLLVLCAWGLFVVAGIAFASYSQHWPITMPRTHPWLPVAAMGAAQIAVTTGVLILMVAGLLVLPALVHLLRSESWRSMWALVRAAVISATVAGAASVVIIAWNHHLGPSPTATTPSALRAASAVGGLLVVGALAASSVTAVAIVYRLDLSHRVTHLLGVLAMAMAGVLFVIFAGAMTWWMTLVVHEPWFLGSLVPRYQSAPAPLAVIMLGLVMVIGLVLAGVGTARIAMVMGRTRKAPTPTRYC